MKLTGLDATGARNWHVVRFRTEQFIKQEREPDILI